MTPVLPQPGPLLRSLVTRAGHRRRLTELGLDKDLDDLANDTRASTSTDLMAKIEDAVQKDLAIDCGAEWAGFLRLAWHRMRDAIQTLARTVDAAPLDDAAGREAVHLGFDVPMLSGMLRLVDHRHPAGIDWSRWWTSPVAAWVAVAAKVGGLAEAEIVARLHVTPRTTERWMAGEPVRELQWPFRQKVLDASAAPASDVAKVDRLTGWLMVAVAFQSLPPDLRDRVRRDFELRAQQPWTMADFIDKLDRRSLPVALRPIRMRAYPLFEAADRHTSPGAHDLPAARRQLDDLQRLIDAEPPQWQRSYQAIHDGLSARLAGLEGRKDDALALYARAVDGVWWCGGPGQGPTIDQALVYAVGVGDKRAAELYWDRTFMLGVNRGPKRPLDLQERRRLGVAFEDVFAPQQAVDRTPTPFDPSAPEAPFELDRKAFKSLNSKVRIPNERTRRTPFMNVVEQGTLDDVKRALAAGGDPDDFVPESGEGPLTVAMRRACDHGDRLVMDHLLRLPLRPDTVNRPASTGRETPLKIAIEMGDAAAVERLVVLGADVEQASDALASALVYAMILLHGSIHRDDPTQDQGWLDGKTRADEHDARDGATLDIDVAARRQRLARLRDASPQARALYRQVIDAYTREPAPRRQVVRTLLRLGADANRRYKVEPHHLAEWTPTLFAAQVGDLDIFKAMLERGGDPDQVLLHSSAMDRQDAMWVAVAHGRHAIVDLLVKRARG